MTDSSAPGRTEPQPGTMEHFRIKSQACRTLEDLASVVKEAGDHLQWIRILMSGAVRDVLFYERARERCEVRDGMTLTRTERAIEDWASQLLMRHSEKPADIPECEVSYEQLKAILATFAAADGAAWTMRAAACELNPAVNGSPSTTA